MKNFLSETCKAISDSKHTPADIKYIGSSDGYSCKWDQFEMLANHTYDNGYGSAKIPSDLVIVFRDGHYLEREEYDGSEWWRHVQPFKIPRKQFMITKVIGTGYSSGGLKELNTED